MICDGSCGGDGGGGGGGGTTLNQTLNLDTVFTGYTPDGAAPWLVATFTETGSSGGLTTGTLTLTSDLSASDFLQGLESPSAALGWGFYLDSTDFSSFNISCSSGTCANSILTSGINAGPVPGGFNLAFGWSSQDRFMSGSSAVYDLSFSSFVGNPPFIANADGWSSVAHVQGITGGCSGWIVSGSGTVGTQNGPCVSTPPNNVPEPGVLGMFGLGVLMIGLFIGLRQHLH